MKFIKIKFVVSLDYRPGDYAVLYGNGGSGAIDWNSPLSGNLDLFPSRYGIYGYGHFPYGHNRYGRAYSSGPVGYGHLPYGHFTYGLGTAVIESVVEVITCGNYKFAFKAFDSLGNAHVGTPDEILIGVHLAPPAPAGLKKVSYDKNTNILTLEVAA